MANFSTSPSPSGRRALAPRRKPKGVLRVLLFPFTVIAAIVVLLEDWLWDDLQRFAAWVGSWPIFHSIERGIVALPPWGALAIFLVPSLILIPVKLLALYFISRGHAVWGIITIIAAKLGGTALVARLFTLTKAKLLTFSWFNWTYSKVTAFKRRIYDFIKASFFYQATRRAIENIKLALRRL